MVIGFILISGEAILVHRWLPGSNGMKKSVHLCLQGVALACGIFGIWTKFYLEKGVVANFYSLHSWMGLICISLFGAQLSGAFGKLYGQSKPSNDSIEPSRSRGGVRENCIHSIVALKMVNGKVKRFSTSGLDGKVVVWNLENQPEFSS